VIAYTLFYILCCVFFGKFWIEAAGMGPKDIANQITESGLSIPGFRRDPRIIETVLNRYIPIIAVVGSIIVGLLAVLSDLTGAIGTGTGILLTVGIIYRFNEDFKREKVFETHPGLKKILTGKE